MLCVSRKIHTVRYCLDLCTSIAWMFNCIGHNNHRYFMVFIIFMWLGTCHVVNCGWARMFVLLDVRMVSKEKITVKVGHYKINGLLFLVQGFLNNLVDTFGMVSRFLQQGNSTV